MITKHGPIFFNNFFTRIKNTNHAHKAENRPINRVGNEGKRPETHNTTIRHWNGSATFASELTSSDHCAISSQNVLDLVYPFLIYKISTPISHKSRGNTRVSVEQMEVSSQKNISNNLFFSGNFFIYFFSSSNIHSLGRTEYKYISVPKGIFIVFPSFCLT